MRFARFSKAVSGLSVSSSPEEASGDVDGGVIGFGLEDPSLLFACGRRVAFVAGRVVTSGSESVASGMIFLCFSWEGEGASGVLIGFRATLGGGGLGGYALARIFDATDGGTTDVDFGYSLRYEISGAFGSRGGELVLTLVVIGELLACGGGVGGSSKESRDVCCLRSILARSVIDWVTNGLVVGSDGSRQ